MRQYTPSKIKVAVIDLDLPQLTDRLARLVIAETSPATGLILLWDDVEDFHKIEDLTLRLCRFIPKSYDQVSNQKRSAFLTELTQGILDFASRKHGTRIRDLLIAPGQKTFIVVFRNGKTYKLPRKFIKSLDQTTVKAARVAGDGSSFTVEQASGKVSEIPWDFVLYHREPDYEYYKGKNRQRKAERDTASRIGRRLKDLRAKLGLTANELATRSGIRRPNVTRLENGKHVPSLETLERLAEALGVPVTELVG
ncbi:MAG: helix-turn-helix domain-containing protein [Armatimonadota bacterium]